MLPPLNAADVKTEWEVQILEKWWREAARSDAKVPDPDAETKFRTPQTIQRALWALSKSSFFAGLAERTLIFDLNQVYRYLHDSQVRYAAQARLAEAVNSKSRVLVGHSLGSVVAYEALCAHPEWKIETFVTLVD